MLKKASFTLDATRTYAISPYIYGINFPDWKGLAGLTVPLVRQGGNRMTAYNWETNASNAGSDWHHQNDSYMGTADEPGHAVKVFLDAARQHNATTILTVPMAGYVAADKKGDGDVNQTPSYLRSRFKRSLPKKPGKCVYPPDTSDDTVYQDEFVAWIEKQRGKSEVWYALDNEPDIWAGTHVRIVPKTPTYAAFLERSIAYAAALKAVAPNAKICGPVSYGWQGFRRFQDAADANNRDFLDFYLAGMQAADKKTGKRLLDCLDLHFYPEAQGEGGRITEDKPGNAAARIQAPRSLWDASYIEKSWIADSLGKKPIALLPRVLKQIASNYPGTKLAITEYHYGGRNEISGVLSQADVLGIYGRYGVFAACIWGMTTKDTAQMAAFRAFEGFGEQGIRVSGETPAEDSVYAARSKNQPGTRVIALNKTDAPREFTLTLKGVSAKSVTAVSITQNTLTRSLRLPATLQGNKINFTAPPLSLVRLELH